MHCGSPTIQVRCNRTIVGAEEERDGICVLSEGRMVSAGIALTML